jgi:hypothetical protein
MIGANVEFDLSEYERFITQLQRDRLPRAAVSSLNDAAFAYRKELQAEMTAKFDRPTPYTLRGFLVDKAGPASGAQLGAAPFQRSGSSYVARVYLNPDVNKQGLSRADTIGHQFTGADPKFTGFERALRRIGVLLPGWHVVPGTGVKLNAYGNVSQGLIVQLISYFSAFGEQGYKANATDKSRARRAKKKRINGGLTINGIEYFISRGRGEFTGRNTWKSGRYQHLPAGIWSRRAMHGVDIAPVFLFVPYTHYTRRIDLQAVARRMDLSGRIGRVFLNRFR